MPSTTADLYDLHKDRDDKDADQWRPTQAIVRMPQPGKETMQVEIPGNPGTSEMAVRHPYVGKTSWLRCMPESGTSVIAQLLKRPGRPEALGYLSYQLKSVIQEGETNESIILRQLRPGELEAMSVGRAYQHWSEDGDITLMGGVVTQQILQTELEWTSRSPTHKRQLDQHDPTTLGQEERFGLVKRPDTTKPNALQIYCKDADKFQYEYLRHIQDDEGKDVTLLHEGHLYDAQQQQIKNSQTNRRVRLRRLVERRQNGTMTFDVDEDLNVIMTNTTTAKLKADLDFGLKSEVKLTSQKLDFNVLKSSNQTFATSLTIRSPKQRYNGTDIGFGPAPVQPAVLGSTLASNVLIPALGVIQSSLSVLAVEPALSPPTRAALQGLAQGLGGISGAVSSVLSTQVKFTA